MEDEDKQKIIRRNEVLARDGAPLSADLFPVLSCPALPDDIDRTIQLSLSLVDLARLASTSRLFREACLAREVNEDAWLCDLAVSYFEPGLVDMFVRWLTLLCTNAINAREHVRLTFKGEWPPDSALSSTRLIDVKGLGRNTASSSGSHSEEFCSGITEVQITNWLDGSCYTCNMYAEQDSIFRVVLYREPKSEEDSKSNYGDDRHGYEELDILSIHVDKREGWHKAAYVALVHLACKALASHGREGRYWEGSARHSLLLQQPPPDGQYAHFSWSDVHQVPHDQAARDRCHALLECTSWQKPASFGAFFGLHYVGGAGERIHGCLTVGEGQG